MTRLSVRIIRIVILLIIVGMAYWNVSTLISHAGHVKDLRGTIRNRDAKILNLQNKMHFELELRDNNTSLLINRIIVATTDEKLKRDLKRLDMLKEKK